MVNVPMPLIVNGAPKVPVWPPQVKLATEVSAVSLLRMLAIAPVVSSLNVRVSFVALGTVFGEVPSTRIFNVAVLVTPRSIFRLITKAFHVAGTGI